MAPRIPAACEKKVFRVLSAASLNDVKDYAAQQFVKNE
jgi:hypothetical protein